MTAPFDPTTLGTGLNFSVNDVPGVCGLATGLDCVANDWIMRLCCPAGGLFYDDDYGPDVTIIDMINSSPSAADLAHCQASWSADIEKDERCASCSATLSLDAPTGVLTISLTGALVTGQAFAFIISASNLTIALLEINGVAVTAAATGTIAAPGVQLVVGPTGQAGAQGQAGADGASGTAQFTADFGDADGENSTGAEEVIYQRQINFDALPGTVTFDLNAYVSSTAGTATFKMSYGGTYGNPDGVLVGSPMTTGSASLVPLQKTATIANPGGKLLVKITAQSSANGQTATMGVDRTLTIR